VATGGRGPWRDHRSRLDEAHFEENLMHVHRKNRLVLVTATALIFAASATAFGQNQPPKYKVIARQEVIVLGQPASEGFYSLVKLNDPKHAEDAHLGYQLVSVVSDGNNRLQGQLIVIADRSYSGDPKPLLAQAREDFLKRLNVTYESDKESVQEEIKRLEGNIHSSEAIESTLTERLMRIQLNLPSPFTPQGFAEQVDRLKQQQFALRVELAGLKARRDLTLKKIEETKPGKADKNRIEAAKKQLDLMKQKQYLTRGQVEAGQATSEALLNGEQELMKAQAELENAEEALKQPASVVQLRQLLQQTELDLATAEARSEVINQSLANIPTNKIFDYQHIGRDIAFLQRDRESLQKDLREQEDAMSKLRPVKVRDLAPPQFAPKGGELPESQGMGGMGGGGMF
jgi:hypothetical protein